ncbi:MAG: extracellular solute-binding protein [Firmicutes bacterium]|nr:extracellular solute-binding protein [Bacillota bacterium]
MRRQIQKLALLILASLMVLTSAACKSGNNTGGTGKNGGNTGGTTKAPEYLNMDSQLPIVKDGHNVKLKIMIMLGAYYQDMKSLEDVYFVNNYKEKTKVDVEWNGIPKDAFSDTLALMLSTGDLPDVIMKSGISNSTQLKYGEQGYFLNLMENDRLKTYAPNYWALCEKYPEILLGSMMPDGEVYSLGLVRNSVGSVVASKLYFNQEWLNKVGLKVPTTAGEFYNVLKAFKNNDPNGNGIADEVGMYTSMTHLEYVTLGMFGLGNQGMCNGFIDKDLSTGKARYFPDCPLYFGQKLTNA